MFSVLFVCSGNTCRSVMAEWIFNREVKKLGLHDRLEAKSAGIAALEGLPASEEVIELASEQGEDLSIHKATQLHSEMLFDFDLILTMTSAHKDAVLAMVNQSQREVLPPVYLLKAYAQEIENQVNLSELFSEQGKANVEEKRDQYTGSEPNIPDPIGENKDTYKALYLELQYWIRMIIAYLIKNASQQ